MLFAYFSQSLILLHSDKYGSHAPARIWATILWKKHVLISLIYLICVFSLTIRSGVSAPPSAGLDSPPSATDPGTDNSSHVLERGMILAACSWSFPVGLSVLLWRPWPAPEILAAVILEWIQLQGEIFDLPSNTPSLVCSFAPTDVHSLLDVLCVLQMSICRNYAEDWMQNGFFEILPVLYNMVCQWRVQKSNLFLEFVGIWVVDFIWSFSIVYLAMYM